MFRLPLAITFLISTQLVRAVTRTHGRLHGSFVPVPSMPLLKVDSLPVGPVVSRNGTELPPYNTTYYFDQLIDHNNPSLGTFKQRYWHTYEHYELGGAIVLMTPGESNAAPYPNNYMTNRTLSGQIAQQENAAIVVLEHRFYGLSNPVNNLSGTSLRTHTIQQAIEDLEYFARNVVLAQPNGDQVTPDKAPWILFGGSYSAALTSWTMVNKPGLFAAGYASSAVVEAVLDFWRYFEPIRQAMPKNCSADVETVINHIDEVFVGNNETAIQEIKDLFGLGELTHLDDVAGALRNNLWDWQSIQPTSVDPEFFKFCNALEVKDGVSAPESGWGLDYALKAWGNHWTTGGYFNHLCGDRSPEECLGTYDPNSRWYTDTTIDNNLRSWMWIVCNEVGYLQDGAPVNHTTLVTRLVPPAYDLRQCQLMFPDVFDKPPTPAVDHINNLYKGWDVRIENIFFANGNRDPWRDTTMSAEGLNVESTLQQQIGLSNGFHCSDLSVASGLADPTILAVQKSALSSIKRWVAEWKPDGNRYFRIPDASSQRSPIPHGRNGPAPAKKYVSAWNRGPGIA